MMPPSKKLVKIKTPPDKNKIVKTKPTTKSLFKKATDKGLSSKSSSYTKLAVLKPPSKQNFGVQKSNSENKKNGFAQTELFTKSNYQQTDASSKIPLKTKKCDSNSPKIFLLQPDRCVKPRSANRICCRKSLGASGVNCNSNVNSIIDRLPIPACQNVTLLKKVPVNSANDAARKLCQPMLCVKGRARPHSGCVRQSICFCEEAKNCNRAPNNFCGGGFSRGATSQPTVSRTAACVNYGSQGAGANGTGTGGSQISLTLDSNRNNVVQFASTYSNTDPCSEEVQRSWMPPPWTRPPGMGFPPMGQQGMMPPMGLGPHMSQVPMGYGPMGPMSNGQRGPMPNGSRGMGPGPPMGMMGPGMRYNRDGPNDDRARYGGEKCRSDKDRYDKDRYDKDRYDKDRYDKDRYDKDRYDKDRYDKERYDKERYDKDRYDKERYDKERCDIYRRVYKDDKYNDRDRDQERDRRYDKDRERNRDDRDRGRDTRQASPRGTLPKLTENKDKPQVIYN